MVIRKLNLEEWFIQHQLRSLGRARFFNPVVLEADLTRVCRDLGGLEKVPLTALCVKALGLLRRVAPLSHRVSFATPWGARFLEFSESRVNVPILVDIKGRQVLSATVIAKADEKTLDQIDRELQEAKRFDPRRSPVAHFVATRGNYFWNRALLRLLAWAAYRVPQFYAKRGGGISMTTIFSKSSSETIISPVPYGPTALSFASVSVSQREGKNILHLGCGYDHTAMTGAEATMAGVAFVRILSGQIEGLYAELIRRDSEAQG